MEYPNTGALFKNGRKQNEKQPDMTGSLSVEGVGEFWLSAWTKSTKKGEKFMSLAFTIKDAQQEATDDPLGDSQVQEVSDDKLPF